MNTQIDEQKSVVCISSDSEQQPVSKYNTTTSYPQVNYKKVQYTPQFPSQIADQTYFEQNGVPRPPKRALTPFFRFRKQVYHTVKKEHPGMSCFQLTSIINDMYKNLQPEVLSQLKQNYELEKIQVSHQKAAYEKRYGKQCKKARKKVLKMNNRNPNLDIPEPPKRPRSSFFIFKDYMYPILRQNYPHSNAFQLNKFATQHWKQLTQEERGQYEDARINQKNQYELRMEEYYEVYGRAIPKKTW